MDFLEDLFELGNRKRRKRDGSLQNEDHHDHQDDDHDDDHDHHRQYPANSFPQPSTNSAAFLPGIMCLKCSTQTVQGAKFCHTCGSAIAVERNCASCGAKLPANALFCAQCGYRNA
jgi:ribosomal protein L40E